MEHRIKEEMKPIFDKILLGNGINDIHYKSFLIRNGYIEKSSTADHIYGLTSMLEPSSCSKQFMAAYNMLLSQTNIYKLREDGMLLGIEIQKVIFNQRSTLIRKKSIKSWHMLQYTRIDYSTDTALLGYPIKEGKKSSKNFPYFL